MGNSADNGQWTRGHLLGTFCKQNGLMPVKQGNDVVIRLFSGGVAHRVMTIPGGASGMPGDILPADLVEKVKKIESALPFYAHS